VQDYISAKRLAGKSKVISWKGQRREDSVGFLGEIGFVVLDHKNARSPLKARADQRKRLRPPGIYGHKIKKINRRKTVIGRSCVRGKKQRGECPRKNM